jgi:hypothetical protein
VSIRLCGWNSWLHYQTPLGDIYPSFNQ